MTLKRLWLACLCLVGLSILEKPSELSAQSSSSRSKQLQISPQAATNFEAYFHLLPIEEEQEAGNAVPVLLRMIHGQQAFMQEFGPKLHKYTEISLHDPKLHDLPFDSFAQQAIRAGAMSYAEWQYPLRSERPYEILLPDLQSQRQLIGHGMTAWIKQRLSNGELKQALTGIKAQLGCGRHCAAGQVVVSHLVGLSIANSAFDNLELALQFDKCPNLYWSLGSLSPTLQDLGPMVRWELWATPTRLNEPLPGIGDEQWKHIARNFVELFAQATADKYSQEEGEKLQKNLERLAKQALAESQAFSAAEIERMTTEERAMRWLYRQYHRFRSQVESLAYSSPLQVIAAKKAIEAETKSLLDATGAKSSPLPTSLPQAILTCRNFERRAKYLQTIEAIRDYASKHDGHFPAQLADLDLTAPDDPFTEKPFLYEVRDQVARLRQAEIEGFTASFYDYELVTKKN